MIDRVARTLRELAHLRAARSVLRTTPIVPRADGVVIFSMIGHAVLLPYLVAVKSLHARLGRGRIAILDDGTLTPKDRRVLAHHLGDPEILAIADVATGACPTGGCWERLLTLLDLARQDYVIQLDSDTLTLSALPEVEAAIAGNRPFTLLGDPTADANGVLSLPEFMAAYHPQGSGIDPSGPAHIQSSIEGNWDRFPDAAAWRYVRGSAGFAGFPRGGAGRDAAEAFSAAAAEVVGAQKWRRWGSEQVASNFLVANGAHPVLLPYARHLNYWNEAPPADAAFLHFVGTHRYSTGEYRRRTIEAIASLG
ncbi:hypothetical protein [Sphingomonas sp.]|uniref:hypothetical protein n=1 Tax=Sphingomonas sp. TaxID=28214 RepID=UPI003AFFA8A3